MNSSIEKSEIGLLVDGFFLTKRPCPQCGEKMRETDRVNENGFVFVWYECTKGGCDGQWLQKFTQIPD